MKTKFKITITDKDDIVMEQLIILNGKRPNIEDIMDDNLYSKDKNLNNAIVDKMREILAWLI